MITKGKSATNTHMGLTVTLLEPDQNRHRKTDRRVAFTDELVANLTTEKRKQQWTDLECPGLHLQVTARGAKTFWLRRNTRGAKYELHNLGRWPAVTVENARACAAHLKARPLRVIPEVGKLLSQEQRDSLLCLLRHQSTYPTARDCMRVWFMVGYALKQEVVRMKWADLDLRSGVWNLTRETRISLSQPVLEILENRRIAIPESCPWVFPAESKASKGGYFKFPRRPLLKALAKAGVPDEFATKIAGARGAANAVLKGNCFQQEAHELRASQQIPVLDHLLCKPRSKGLEYQ